MTDDRRNSPPGQAARRTTAARLRAVVFLGVLVVGVVLGMSFGNIAVGALIGLALGALFGTAVAGAVMKQAD
jgi:uncharacterized membrane protein YdfJ with MMPL/SSD domain